MSALELIEVTATDGAALAELCDLLSRCSDDVLRSRCFGGSPSAARLLLEALPFRASQLTIAARAEQRMVGVGSLVFEAGGVEIAVLVEDAWHRRGIGTALTARMGVEAARRGAVAVVASMAITNVAAMSLLRSVFHGVALSARPDGLIVAVCPVSVSGSRR